MESGDKSFLTLIVFAAGLGGGFVSIQQRIHDVSDEELLYLARSWPSVLLIPIYGGIFALILHVIFISGILDGGMFPEYYVCKFDDPPNITNLKDFFKSVLPLSGQDTAKMIFWSFCAGFSERLVPQIIQKIDSQIDKNDENVPQNNKPVDAGDV
jgi:hypothetical protein